MSGPPPSSGNPASGPGDASASRPRRRVLTRGRFLAVATLAAGAALALADPGRLFRTATTPPRPDASPASPSPEAAIAPGVAESSPTPLADAALSAVAETLPTPTLAATAEPSPTPTVVPPTATPAPTATSQPLASTPYGAFLEPLVREAGRRRAERRAGYPEEYDRRVDPALNLDRINVLLYGYGVTYEPPNKSVIGSHTILSMSAGASGPRARSIDLVSLTHDIRAPEIERYQRQQGRIIRAARIDGAFATGGFDLQRLVLESATGLAIDFQVNMDELFIQHLIDSTFGTIEVDNPAEFDAQPFYWDGRQLGEKHFARGKVRLDGLEAMRYMKALPLVPNCRIERNARKHLVFKALSDSVEASYANPLWLVKAGVLLVGEVRMGRLVADFQVDDLIVKNLGAVADAIRAKVGGGESVAPRIDRTLYVVNPGSGDGGVQWITQEAETNPGAKADLVSGEYPDPNVEVPIGGNPHDADLVGGYWRSVRSLVRETLLATEAPPRRSCS